MSLLVSIGSFHMARFGCIACFFFCMGNQFILVTIVRLSDSFLVDDNMDDLNAFCSSFGSTCNL